jgi:hypothetical protein
MKVRRLIARCSGLPQHAQNDSYRSLIRCLRVGSSLEVCKGKPSAQNA